MQIILNIQFAYLALYPRNVNFLFVYGDNSQCKNTHINAKLFKCPCTIHAWSTTFDSKTFGPNYMKDCLKRSVEKL